MQIELGIFEQSDTAISGTILYGVCLRLPAHDCMLIQVGPLFISIGQALISANKIKQEGIELVWNESISVTKQIKITEYLKMTQGQLQEGCSVPKRLLTE